MDSYHARYTFLLGVIRQCLYPPRVARIDGFSAVVCNDHIYGLGDCGDAVGVILIEDRKLKIED